MCESLRKNVCSHLVLEENEGCSSRRVILWILASLLQLRVQLGHFLLSPFYRVDFLAGEGHIAQPMCWSLRARYVARPHAGLAVCHFSRVEVRVALRWDFALPDLLVCELDDVHVG